MREQQQQPSRKVKKLFWSREKGECLDPRTGDRILDPKLKPGLTDREWCETLVDLVYSSLGTDDELRPNEGSILCSEPVTWLVSSSHRFVRDEYPDDADGPRFLGRLDERVNVWLDPKTPAGLTVWSGQDEVHDRQVASIEVSGS